MSKPKKCVCDPDCWGDTINKVCSKYKDIRDTAYPEGYCENCAHEEKCHEKNI
jgi:hypothetical protein